MSLRWSIENCENYEELVASDKEREITQYLVMCTIGVGLPGITEDTVEEFYIRMRIQEQVDGPFSMTANLPDIKRRVGMTANVSPITRQQFMAGISKSLVRYAQAQYVRAAAEIPVPEPDWDRGWDEAKEANA